MSADYLDPQIAQQVETPLGKEEFIKRISAPLTDEEIAETDELVRWFTRRYPTVKERLSYARRKFHEVTQRTWVIRPRHEVESDRRSNREGR